MYHSGAVVLNEPQERLADSNLIAALEHLFAGDFCAVDARPVDGAHVHDGVEFAGVFYHAVLAGGGRVGYMY